MQTHREFTTPIVRPLSTAPTAHPAPEVTKAERFAALQRRMQTADVETLVVVPVAHPGEHRAGGAGPGVRGAPPVSDPGAARRVAQRRLRHVVAGGDDHRRLLPVAAPGAPALVGPSPPDDAVGRRCLAAVAQREGAGAARAAGPDPRRDRGPHASRSSCPTRRPTASGTSRSRSTSRCTAPTPGTIPWAPRADAASCSRASARRIRSVSSGSPARATRSPRSPSSAPGARASPSSS